MVQCTEDAAGRQHRRCILPQSSAPEDGRNYRPKHGELIEIINKLLLLHPVGCLYYLFQLVYAENTEECSTLPRVSENKTCIFIT